MPASVHSNGDEALYPVGVHGVEDITQPLLVQVVPVTLIGDVLEQGGLGTGMGEEVICSETLNLGHGSHLHCLSLDVLHVDAPYDSYLLGTSGDLLEEVNVSRVHLGKVGLTLLGEEVVDVPLRLDLLTDLVDVH